MIYEQQGSRHDPDFFYDIQVRQAGDGTWQQRHVWHANSLGKFSPPKPDPWIPSYKPSEAELASFTRVSA